MKNFSSKTLKAAERLKARLCKKFNKHMESVLLNYYTDAKLKAEYLAYGSYIDNYMKYTISITIKNRIYSIKRTVNTNIKSFADPDYFVTVIVTKKRWWWFNKELCNSPLFVLELNEAAQDILRILFTRAESQYVEKVREESNAKYLKNDIEIIKAYKNVV